MDLKQKNVLLLIGVVLLADYLIAQVNNPRIIIKKNLPFNYNAQAIPPFGIYVKEEHKDNQKLIEHELVHWQQYKKTGAVIFFFKYFFQKWTHGYDLMPMEIEARKLVGESMYCQENYTECVQNYNSVTVQNPDFRN